MGPEGRRLGEVYMEGLRPAHPYRQGYFGVTTQVVSVKFAAETTLSSHLAALVGTRRLESVGDTTREYNQEVELKLIKISGKWLVDGVFWREPE